MITFANVVTRSSFYRTWRYRFALGAWWAVAVDGVCDHRFRYLRRCPRRLSHQKVEFRLQFGAILDIAGDRAVEMSYWVGFCALRSIPGWVPILFVIRGTFIDAIRSFASEAGLHRIWC